MATMTITLKLMVDKARNKVVFAESDKDFVDVLLSFLTLPLGTVVRLAGKQSSIGSMDTLYHGVENYNIGQPMAKECKDMLLSPKNVSGYKCEKLRINIDPDGTIRYYICQNQTCSRDLLSYYPNVQCTCGGMMSREATLLRESGGHSDHDADVGVFVNWWTRFVVTDNLVIAPVSDSLSLLSELGIEDEDNLEEREVSIGHSELIALLQLSFVSSTPLSNLFAEPFQYCSPENLRPNPTILRPQTKQEGGFETDQISVKLLIDRREKEILYAEAKKDFIELLFSFLTFPSGSLVNLLGDALHGCSIGNLYKSAENLSLLDCLFAECRDMLLETKLPRRYGYKSQQLRIDEENVHYFMNSTSSDWYEQRRRCGCLSKHGYRSNGLFAPYDKCKHGESLEQLVKLMDPKDPNKFELGEGFLKGTGLFIITDELRVMPLSVVSSISLRKREDGSLKEVEQMTVDVGEEKALALLWACLTSRKPLTAAFLSNEHRNIL